MPPDPQPSQYYAAFGAANFLPHVADTSYATHLQRATWRYSEGGRFMEVQLYLHIS